MPAVAAIACEYGVPWIALGSVVVVIVTGGCTVKDSPAV